jgi:septum formation topological specificity factor MinE
MNIINPIIKRIEKKCEEAKKKLVLIIPKKKRKSSEPPYMREVRQGTIKERGYR